MIDVMVQGCLNSEAWNSDQSGASALVVWSVSGLSSKLGPGPSHSNAVDTYICIVAEFRPCVAVWFLVQRLACGFVVGGVRWIILRTEFASA